LFVPMRRNEAAIAEALQEQASYRQGGRRMTEIAAPSPAAPDAVEAT
jgi:hypothetical protein